MSAAAAKAKLEALIARRSPVTVTEAALRSYPLVPSLVRQRFENGKDFEVTADGVGVRLENGDWMFVTAEN